MKKIILFISLFISVLLSNAQTNFKWDVMDSIQKTKSQIYSDTKMFIAETWKSSKDVLQNDDKDAGIILVKGVSILNRNQAMRSVTYVFNYNVTFKMKDNKLKIIIDNVNCESAICHANGEVINWPSIPVADTYPSEKGLRLTNMNEDNYLKLMTSLKTDLQTIVDSYALYIKKPSPSDSGW